MPLRINKCIYTPLTVTLYEQKTQYDSLHLWKHLKRIAKFVGTCHGIYQLTSERMSYIALDRKSNIILGRL